MSYFVISIVVSEYCGFCCIQQQQLSHTPRTVQLSDHHSAHCVAAATHVFQQTVFMLLL